MRVTRDDILRMAKLARLEFGEAELEGLAGSLDELIGYMDRLKSLDLKDVEPLVQLDDAPRPLRPDAPVPGLSRDEAFRNAPEVSLDHFSVPKVIGGA